jgi:GxxExxY protein
MASSLDFSSECGISTTKEHIDHEGDEIMETDDIMALCDKVREIAYAIHAYHGNGYLEKIYENALIHRLRKAGLSVTQQHPITVRDEDDTVIGEYFADIIVCGNLLIELKACKAMTNEHRSQILNYLKATGIEHGLLINFGSYKFEIQKFVQTEQF